MESLALEMIAKIIIRRLDNTMEGHCIRIDYFDKEISIDLYKIMIDDCLRRNIGLYILGSV